ncbi:MAG TPA: orotidine-5'-phosphate decarboxylase [Gaiellaceae bacterium]|nr:orotidine-5'-phosphate decarboxylase [Gaiellaceae bacterium]
MFGDRLAEAVERKRSQLVVGLDPVAEKLPAAVGGDVGAFCRGIVDAVAEHAVAVKPQSAFFELYGAEGVRTFEQVCTYARDAGLLVVADVKRGDIGSTARAYASAYAGVADAVTVNPYLGRDSLVPFVDTCRERGTGLFCLVKTSNPGSADLQDEVLRDGRRLWERVAELVGELGDDLVGDSGLSSVGAVVGATFPAEVAEARALLPHAPFLLPGIGAQGGRPLDAAAAFAPGPGAGLVSASRSVIYASAGGDWREAATAAAAALARETWDVAAAA